MATATASMDLAKQSGRGRLFVALAAVAWSSAGVLQREVAAVGLQARAPRRSGEATAEPPIPPPP